MNLIKRNLSSGAMAPFSAWESPVTAKEDGGVEDKTKEESAEDVAGSKFMQDDFEWRGFYFYQMNYV